MLTMFFLLLRFFFLGLKSEQDVFDDESENDGSGSGFTIESGSSALCPFLKFLLIVFVE